LDCFVAQNFAEYFETDGSTFSVRPNRNGTATRDIITDISFDVNFAGGTLILETEPIENLSAPFFETPETYIVQVAHINLRTMYAFDCYSLEME
jgi:hypothetical protein